MTNMSRRRRSSIISVVTVSINLQIFVETKHCCEHLDIDTNSESSRIPVFTFKRCGIDV